MKLTKDTIIFITGGASGLGLATAQRFHQAGCKVAIADIDEKGMESVKTDFSKASTDGADRILTFKCDVTVEDDVRAAMEATAKAWGGIHVALASAGIDIANQTLTSKGMFNIKNFKKVMDINVYGSVYVAKYASMIMSRNKPVNAQGEKGVILFISSIAAEDANRGQVPYGASKGAINGLVLPMARDLGKFGIRCVAIAPGVFATPMGAGAPPRILNKLRADIPWNRFGDPTDFAHFSQAIVENSYLNGVRLRIDGAMKISFM